MLKTKFRPVHAANYGGRLFDTMTAATLFILQQDQPKDWRIELMDVADCVPDAQTLAEFDRRDNSVGCNL